METFRTKINVPIYCLSTFVGYVIICLVLYLLMYAVSGISIFDSSTFYMVFSIIFLSRFVRSFFMTYRIMNTVLVIRDDGFDNIQINSIRRIVTYGKIKSNFTRLAYNVMIVTDAGKTYYLLPSDKKGLVDNLCRINRNITVE